MITTTRTIEKQLTTLVAGLRQDCGGDLPEDFDLHLEDVAHALGLDDAALRRILATDQLPSERPLGVRLRAEVEVAITEARARGDYTGAMDAARRAYEQATRSGQG